MNDILQSGHHPDADQLNAFVEHALPAHEYEQTLAHLAVCPDCRTVVALSIPPMEEHREPQIAAIHKPWFSGWKLAWPVAAAFATLAIAAIYIRNSATMRSRAVPTERAELHAPAAGPAPTAPSMAASKPAVPPSSTNSSAPVPTQKAEVASNAKINNANSPSAAARYGEGIVLRDRSQSSSENALSAGSAIPPAPSAPAAAPGTLARLQAQAGVAPPPEDNVAKAFNQSTNLPSGGQLLKSASAHGVLDQAAALTQPLPSHLSAISIAAAAHRVLAIDAQNTLFFSGDDGKTWKAITPQWQGRAVKVDLASPAITRQSSSGTGANVGSSPGFDKLAGTLRAEYPKASSTLTGKVMDVSGAVVADADIVVTNAETAKSREVKTDHSGNYAIGDLAPGQYQVKANAPGFQQQASTISMAASEQRLANFTLAVGSATETVAVETKTSPIPLVEPPASNKKIATPAAVNAQLPLFELTTEDGSHWMSSDGQTWKRKSR